MLQVAGKIRVLEGYRPETLPLQELLSGGEPAVLKGLVDEWALVRAGRNSDQHAMNRARLSSTLNRWPAARLRISFTRYR